MKCPFFLLFLAHALLAQPATDWRAMELEPIPAPVLAGLEPQVAEQLEAMRVLVLEVRASSERLPVAEAFGDLGRVYHAYDMTDSALAAYTNAARLSPASFRWRYLRSVVLGALGQTAKAAEELAEAMAIEPSYPAALIYAGELHSALEQPRRAEAFLRVALELEPRSAAALAGMGQIALSRRRYSEAIALFRQALEYVPDATRLHYPLALAYRGLGEIDRARSQLEASGEVGVRANDPVLDEVYALRDGERAHLLQGRLAFEAGSYDDAAAAFRRALLADPASVRARINLASALSAQGSRELLEEGERLLREALDLEADNATAAFNLGMLLVQSGRPQEAVPALERAVRLSPRDPALQVELTRVLRIVGRPQRALEQAVRAVELEPRNPSARLQQAAALVDLERFREALEFLELSHVELPTDGGLAVALARLLAASPDRSLRNGERALGLAERVYEAQPTPSHAETLALALAELGRCEEAADVETSAISAFEEAGIAGGESRRRLARYRAGPPCRQ